MPVRPATAADGPARRGLRDARAAVLPENAPDAAFAAAGGHSRLDWTTKAKNGRARACCAKLGIPVAPRLMYRMEGAALAAAARGDWPAPVTEPRA